MAHIDVFNGDADGICALTQLRNASPVESLLVTGVKRDIELLERVDAGAGDRVTVLDVSFDKNRGAVVRLLDRGAEVFYADHHFAGELPRHGRLTALIDTAADVCTSLLIDRHLEGRFRAWAVTGAFGDNLDGSARALAGSLGVNDDQLLQLKDLGTFLNYNGYGAAIEDLHFPPAELFERVRPYPTPFAFLADDRETFERLATGYHQDMAAAAAVQPAAEGEKTAVYVLPDAAWARRVSGVFSNQLARSAPARAHAVLTARADGGYVVSVRAPLDDKVGADELCRRFPTGGGRQAAAGINDLPADRLDDFVAQFTAFYAA